mgnify:CR=1 FL=1|tara:strand:- start:861 stop:1733 length:873 start_codon:yes stop_codon:yes gene_type:complete
MNKLVVLSLVLASAAGARQGDRPSVRMQRPKTEPVLRLRGGGVAAAAAAPSKSVVGMIAAQLAKEVASSTTHPAKFFGFCGACCNWFLGLSAVYDASQNGPEVIALPMTLAMLMYSLLFSRWAGWDVSPKNFMLSGSHMFNVVAQLNQLRRVLEYKLEKEAGAKAEVMALAQKSVLVAALITAYALAAPKLKAMSPEGTYLASAGGPFTIHPWPPVTKLFLSAASLTDLHRPTDKISLTQYAALTLTGFIFTFYGLYVTPINYPLTSVNILLFFSSLWHLSRKIKADFID